SLASFGRVIEPPWKTAPRSQRAVGSRRPAEVGSANRLARMLRAAVAAGHPATTAAGVEILEAGGSAADAAVAACLASCVAETVMTGLLGGGHAIWWDAAAGRASLLDCFCTVPSGTGGELLELQVPFG